MAWSRFSWLRPGEKDSWDRASISGTWPSPSTDALPCSEQSCINLHEAPFLARDLAPLFTEAPPRPALSPVARQTTLDSVFGPNAAQLSSLRVFGTLVHDVGIHVEHRSRCLAHGQQSL